MSSICSSGTVARHQVMAGRIALSRNDPNGLRHRLTRMLPARRHFVNRHPTESLETWICWRWTTGLARSIRQP